MWIKTLNVNMSFKDTNFKFSNSTNKTDITLVGKM